MSAAANTSSQTVKNRISEIRRDISKAEVISAFSIYPALKNQVQNLNTTLDFHEKSLLKTPSIEVSFLGSSRHGKSTLLNSLIGYSILPTSDTRPCTASIVKLKWAKDWAIKIKFISQSSLVHDWKMALNDAKDFCNSRDKKGTENQEVDDSNYLINSLSRFLDLFGIDRNQPPLELIREVEKASVPMKLQRLLGKEVSASNKEGISIEQAREIIEDYLTTKKSYWTIVESCSISGPFQDWHESLELIDLPGTNDTNPHRTAITNSLREKSKVVAIATAESNLGVDIENWLRSSAVLKNFLEAKDSSRQRLCIVRTKLDNHTPTVDSKLLNAVSSEDEEDALTRQAMEDYKEEQSESYHDMLKNMVLPALGGEVSDQATIKKRGELLDRMESIPVHYVSSQAYEAINGTGNFTRKQRRKFQDEFNDDIKETGVPKLTCYLNRIAEEYLSQNFYEDILTEIEGEAGLIAQYFRKELSVITAKLSGNVSSLDGLVQKVRSEIAPWVRKESQIHVKDLGEKSSQGTKSIDARLDQVNRMSHSRLADKLEIWTSIAWNSLRAAARKGGTHTTSAGRHIDIPNDLCGVLVDDILLAWTAFRDELIEQEVHERTNQLSEALLSHLNSALPQAPDRETREAIQAVSDHLVQISENQRNALLRATSNAISQYESIRKPIQKYAADKLKPLFEEIGRERGEGCAKRMRNILENGFPQVIDDVRNHVNLMVKSHMKGLSNACGSAIGDFGERTATLLEYNVNELEKTCLIRDREVLGSRQKLLSHALLALPSPTQVSTKVSS